jgi:nucleoid-associated protein YgaU
LLGPRPRTTDAGEVVVRRGDTLWSIAARNLGPRPSDSQIAQAWPAWYDANRDVIGDDPGLLLPGQVLRAPHTVTS